MRQFTKDDPRINRSGRPKGKPNKTTEELRAMFQTFLEANIETLQQDFDQLEPKDRLAFIEKLAKLVLPAPLHDLEKIPEEQLEQLYNKLKSEMIDNLNEK